MPRTILVHLNIEARDDDERTADDFADLVQTALDSADEASGLQGIEIVIPLAEEV